jgi:DNA-binding HxlR family transcriptional regulator
MDTYLYKDGFSRDTVGETCTVYNTIDIIGRKWSLLIILSIHKSENNKRQYTSIKKDLSTVTGKILSKRLKELENENIITKTIDSSQMPVNTFYSLTASGKGLIRIIDEIKKWGLEHKFRNDKCKATFCKNCRL